MKLIYVGDPMCSWCYGFGKELAQLRAELPQLPLEIVVGGVRAGSTELLDDAGKAFRLEHWQRVQALSGLPFNRAAFIARSGFTYDTEPVCRAVVAARELEPRADLLQVFRDLQTAFYVDGRDTTSEHELAAITAQALALQGTQTSPLKLLEALRNPLVREQTQTDFALARSWGVRSFPALLLAYDNQRHIIAAGYSPAKELVARLQPWVAAQSMGA
jgi:putative protein-disulfide isomerase